MSIEDMPTRQAECYLDIFRDLLKDMAAILLPAEEVDDKVNKLLLSIKNIMTGRVVTNKSFFTQLQKWRSEVIPVVVRDFEQLPDDSKEKLTRMNHLFCGLHVLHNLGIYAETAMKEFVKIASMTDKHGGFVTSNSRVYDMLYEISKLCCYNLGDQRS